MDPNPPNYSSFAPYTPNYNSNHNPSPPRNQHTASQYSPPHHQHPQPPSSARPYIDSALSTTPPSHGLASSNFDILDWHPAYQSCQKYFLDHAQHDPGTQAVCALINIRLPYQWRSHPVVSSKSSSERKAGPSSSHGGNGNATNNSNNNNAFTFSSSSSSSNNPAPTRPNPSPSSSSPSPPPFISLLPYLRRLLVTGFANPPILHGFFGDDYVKGILPHLECERRNYLFAAKSGGWRSCKRQYDVGAEDGGGGGETVPFLKALREVEGVEVRVAEREWGRWLGMEDWMVGRESEDDGKDGGVKMEEEEERGRREGGGEIRGGHL